MAPIENPTTARWVRWRLRWTVPAPGENAAWKVPSHGDENCRTYASWLGTWTMRGLAMVIGRGVFASGPW